MPHQATIHFMKILFISAACLLILLVTINLFAQAETNSMAIKEGFVKTNGEYVEIGSFAFRTNSALNTDEFK